MFQAIPDEMKSHAQWVVWRYVQRTNSRGEAEQTKPLYNAMTGALASVTDPTTWTTFDNVCAAAGRYDGIGFVLTNNDPYTIIDLDDPGDDEGLREQHGAILRNMKSYAEWSPSGKGAHIVVRGHVEKGRRRAKVEVYSTERYMTMTGNVFQPFPIEDRQEQLNFLYEYISAGKKDALREFADRAEVATDREIFERASRAENGDKFKNLWNGEFRAYVNNYGSAMYPSQSEADQALINILQFYSRNRTQVARIFRLSALGQRDKAKRDDYVMGMVNKSFDREVPDVKVDTDAFRNSLQNEIDNRQQAIEPGAVSYVVNGHVEAIEQLPAVEVIAVPNRNPYRLPPGLVGQIAQYIFQSSPRPVEEISLAGALGFIAGVCGRQYNTYTRTGLNIYLLLLAPTGTGKEAVQLGIDRLFTAVKRSGENMLSGVPAADTFEGPGEIASGAALRKAMAKRPCFVSVIGEVGLRMERMAAPNASASEKQLQAVLLDLYNKSGAGQSLKSSVYSDTDKNVSDIQSPALTIVGESVPERLYSAIDENFIASGLLPRFSIIEYTGPRPAMQDAPLVEVPDALRTACATLCAHVLELHHKNSVQTVELDADASAILRAFDKHADAQINAAGDSDVIRHLWNRAHVKALRLGSLLAVGCNPYQPTMTGECAQWACDFVNHEVELFLGKFRNGEIGRSDTDESRQLDAVRRVLLEYAQKPYAEISKYMNGLPQSLHTALIVPMTYLQRRLYVVSCMKKDRQGPNAAIKRTVDVLTKNGALRVFDPVRLANEYQTTAVAYQLVSPELLSG